MQQAEEQVQTTITTRHVWGIVYSDSVAIGSDRHISVLVVWPGTCFDVDNKKPEDLFGKFKCSSSARNTGSGCLDDRV